MRKPTSVSDIDSYIDICKRAFEDDAIFNNFKTFDQYTQILEHTSVEFGYDYLKILIEKFENKNTLDILKKSCINDILGGTRIYSYNIGDQAINISPSTLYYTKIWSDIITLFGKTEKLNIIEIGGGYGGQCLVANNFTGFNSWSIYDLPEVCNLQKKYLNKHNVKNVSFYESPLSGEELLNFNNHDLLISNFSFSEVNREIQEQYLKLIKSCKNGYMIMNYGWNLPNLYSVDELKQVINNLKIEEENPKTGPNNILLWWKNSMNKQTEFIFNIINNPMIKSVLNIGYKFDSDQTILNACVDNNKSFSVLEAYGPNCDVLKTNNKIKSIYNMDVRNINQLDQKFDAIIWLHGPEHILWNEFLLIKDDIEKLSNYITIYQAPEGEYPQDDIYGNPYERHVQTLYQSMFAELGYETNNFIQYGEKTFSAYRRNRNILI